MSSSLLSRKKMRITSIFLVQQRNEALRDSAPAFAAAGWSARGLGLAPGDWLADPAGPRVDALVAWRVLAGLEEGARRALLDQVPRRAGRFVALEESGAFAEGELTALWPAWHSCVLRERRGWRIDLFEAAAL